VCFSLIVCTVLELVCLSLWSLYTFQIIQCIINSGNGYTSHTESEHSLWRWRIQILRSTQTLRNLH
jgi:hypothetical protein